MFLTVKIPVMDDYLTPRKRNLLMKFTARDTTIIKRYLAIIEQEQESLWKEGKKRQKKKNEEKGGNKVERKKKKRLTKDKLDGFTLTSNPLTRKNKEGEIIRSPGRTTVEYDLKEEFGSKITVRELKECRDVAVEM